MMRKFKTLHSDFNVQPSLVKYSLLMTTKDNIKCVAITVYKMFKRWQTFGLGVFTI